MFTLLILIVVLICSSKAVFAANPWPNLSSTKYLEYKATHTMNVYKDKDCTIRGTENPDKAYKAIIEPNDICKIYKITTSYTKVNYPTPNGRRTGYAKTKEVFSTTSPVYSYVTHEDKLTTYDRIGGKKIGYSDPSDYVFVLTSDGNYYSVIYEAKSGNRAYKYGWLKYRGFWFSDPLPPK